MTSMSDVEILEKNCSVVLVGQFNTSHHIPELLVNYGIINEEDLKSTSVRNIGPGLIDITLPWGRLLAEPRALEKTKMILSSFDWESKILFNDFVKSIINYNDTAAPSLMGLNYTGYIKHPDRESWDHFGRLLTPQDRWKSIFSKEDNKVGMNSVSVRIYDVFDVENIEGIDKPELNIAIKPVRKTPLNPEITIDYCTEISFNYHFKLGDITDRALRALKVIDAFFLKIHSDFENNINAIIEEFR